MHVLNFVTIMVEKQNGERICGEFNTPEAHEDRWKVNEWNKQYLASLRKSINASWTGSQLIDSLLIRWAFEEICYDEDSLKSNKKAYGYFQKLTDLTDAVWITVYHRESFDEGDVVDPTIVLLDKTTDAEILSKDDEGVATVYFYGQDYVIHRKSSGRKEPKLADWRKIWKFGPDYGVGTEEELGYYYGYNRQLRISEYRGSDKSVIIPRYIRNKAVTTVGTGSFRKNETVENVVIPEGVLRIESGAFSDCPVLKKISLPSTICSIGSKAFKNLPGLQEISVSGKISLVPDMVYKCPLIEEQKDFQAKILQEKKSKAKPRKKKPISSVWKDKLFAVTGLEEQEATVLQQITQREGTWKDYVTKKTDCLIYNPDYGYETVKLKTAKEYNSKGCHIRIMTHMEFESLIEEGKDSELF